MEHFPDLVEGDLNGQIVDLEFDLNFPPPSPQQSNEPNEPITQNQPTPHKQRITNQMRQEILLHLLNISVNGVLPHGSINKTAEKFGYSRRSISFLWNKA